MRKIFSFLLLLFVGCTYAQELNCTINVNADQVGGTNTQVYKTLQKSLADFVNKTNWTNQGFKSNEKINCSMFINISAANSNQYTATIQVQSSRPVFNSTYASPVFNFNDKEFSFEYTEFQNILYNPASFESNLSSVISYYCFMILGIDADTFAPEGGTDYLETARAIVTVAQSGNAKGWSGNDGNSNRYFLINDMLSPTYAPYREAMYQYHSALDNMTTDLKGSKEKVKLAVSKLSEIYSVRPNAFIMRVFFDAKSDELVSVFSGGPNIPVADLVDQLNRFSPLNSAKWAGIKL